jgi:CubicO group peptidase (beta-lactamase class C family)
MTIKGYTNRDYADIAESFKENFEMHGEIGASLCVYHDHKKVIDIWGGHKDPGKNEEWDENTVVPIFSTTKAIAAGCLAICHSRGLFGYDRKVCDFWPEFGVNNKELVTIEQLLQHRAGLSAIDNKLDVKTIRNRGQLETIIAEQKPHWIPGDYQGYHVWNIGWYISSLLKRVDPERRFLKEFFEQEVLPGIEGEIRIGVEKNYDWSKIATLKPFSKMKGMVSMPAEFVFEFFKPWSLSFKSMLNPSFVTNHSNFNKPEILQLEIGAGGGIANARGLASFIDSLSNASHPLCLKRETLDYLMEYPAEPKKGWEDIVFKQDAFRFHAGFMKPSEKHNFSQSTKAYGGFGAGGSFVFHDPDNKVTIGYTMNNMSSEMMNMKREVTIRNSVYKTIANIVKHNAG